MRSQGCRKGAPNAPKSTQEGSWARNWRTFVVKMPLLKASRFLNAFVHVFLCFFEGSDLKNSMVFTSPNQRPLPLQKVRFLSLFGALLAPKMLTFGTHWRPEGGKSRSWSLIWANEKKHEKSGPSRVSKTRIGGTGTTPLATW